MNRYSTNGQAFMIFVNVHLASICLLLSDDSEPDLAERLQGINLGKSQCPLIHLHASLNLVTFQQWGMNS